MFPRQPPANYFLAYRRSVIALAGLFASAVGTTLAATPVIAQAPETTLDLIRSIGWQVHDDPTIEIPRHNVYIAKLPAARLQFHLNSSFDDISETFTEEEKFLLSILTDGDISNDEIAAFYVTPDKLMVVEIVTSDPAVGWNGGYLATKPLREAHAETLARIVRRSEELYRY